MFEKRLITVLSLAFFMLGANAQVDTVKQSPHMFEFDGQASAYLSFSPDNELDWFVGVRYLPELNYAYTFKNEAKLDFEVSANMYGSVLFHPFDNSKTDGDISPYRLWGRYSGKQYEVRVGLQKIDFGTAMLLRSLQWFDEIDPRDPLKFTTGVYGALGRYYFLNNANIWAWVLYGNENPRGFEVMKNNADIPEFGGRIQYPVPKGEIAATYHHRNASSEDLTGFPSYDNIPENRYALDGKWDVGVGVWFEAAYINKTKDVGMFTNQTYLTFGTDYTFGIGSGLNVTLEHLLSSYDEDAFTFENNSNITATSISYPLGFFDNISAMAYYAWDSEDVSFFLNYEHQFQKLTGYVMGYYNPDSQISMGSVQYENSFAGPGVRLMLVYNH